MIMKFSRRDFLKYCSIAAGALGISSSAMLKLDKAMANAAGPDVVWLQGAGCNGCTVSFANSVYNGNTPAHLLIDVLNLAYHPTLMAAAGEKAVESAYDAYATSSTNPFVLVVEGSIQHAVPPGPVGNTNVAGDYCKIWDNGGVEENMLNVTRAFAANAAVVLAIGNCASYGGIPGATGNVTDARGVYDSLVGTAKKKVVNIPGCPAHPDWFVGTVAYIIDAINRGKSRVTPNLDSLRRPAEYYPERNCNSCSKFTKGTIAHPVAVPGKGTGFASVPGELGNKCLKYVGCRGSRTKSDCPTRKWNADAASLGAGVNWCVGAGANCAGCTQPNFPDRFTPLYGLK